jgi:NAD(P)-dependent dehydrogenase (short-subunit alcohol dehydrogenase family)
MSAAPRPVALVTGARRGIGRGCGEALARAGFDIAATDLVIDAAASEAQEAFEAAGARVAFIPHDVAKIESHAALVASVLERFDRLDCLVSNAGRGAVVRGDLLDLRPENFDAVMNVNLRGALFLAQAAARAMMDAQSREHARSIIAITSVSAEMVSPERTEYCVSKAALSMAMKAFAARLAPEGIAVFEVRPGIIRTDLTAPVAGRYEAAIADGLVPARRWGEAADVGAIVAGLASGQFGFATGSVIAADGGLSLPRL